jgi:non-specific serine/threonine protein kinase
MDSPLPGDAPPRLGQRVWRFRVEAGLSQRELALRMGVKQPSISQIETGKIVGPLHRLTVAGLANALGVTIDDLIAGDPAYATFDVDDSHHAPRAAALPSAVPLVGRDDIVERVAALLGGDARLVTLIGPGGVGKTQLALHVASTLEGDCSGGVFAVSLAACRDPGGVVGTIARGVDLHEQDGRTLRSRLLSELPRGRFLLLLDNAEQAVAAVAELCADLLAAYPHGTLLVTSRTRLNIRGERPYPVRPLALPDPARAVSVANAAAAPAVALFVLRAREVSPSFAVTEANAAQVVAICQRLDGLPLAIELAAARMSVFSPAHLLRQLERRLASLTAGSRDLPARQRSLRASIEWSVALLDAGQQALLRRLAVFAGGFTLDAATEVAGDHAADHLAPLLAHHLLVRKDQADGTPRFVMLETIHEFAREQLERAGEAATYRARHLAWCRALAERSLPKMFTAEESLCLAQLQQEDANFRAALAWAFGPGRETDLEAGLRLAGALTDYWYVSGQLSEGRTWLTQAIALSANRTPSVGQARSLVGAGLIEQVQAAADLAAAHGEQGLALARALADQSTIGRALLLIGNVAMMHGELERARCLHAQALAHFDRLGHRAWSALALINLGMDFFRQGQLEPAARCAEEALTIARAIGDTWDTIVALRLLGEISRERGDLDRAATLFAESLALGWRHGSEREAADSLSGIAATTLATGDLDQAARLLGAAATLYRRLEIEIPPPLRPDWPAIVARVQAGLGPRRFASAWQSRSPEHIIGELIASHRGADRRSPARRTSAPRRAGRSPAARTSRRRSCPA